MSCCSLKTSCSGSAEILTPVGNDRLYPLDLGCSDSKTPDVCGLETGRNIARHRVKRGMVLFWENSAIVRTEAGRGIKRGQRELDGAQAEISICRALSTKPYGELYRRKIRKNIEI